MGASDNLVRGQSTFMVEMSETSAILHGASARSLVLLDEVGRGTSTYDGVAIAWAVTEFLHTAIGCKTIFATHYHELTQLTEELAHARNYNVGVREVGDEIVFLHRLEPGGADRSYGIHVGRLAGLPAPVLSRANEVLRLLEAGHRVAHQPVPPPSDAQQLALLRAGSAPPVAGRARWPGCERPVPARGTEPVGRVEKAARRRVVRVRYGSTIAVAALCVGAGCEKPAPPPEQAASAPAPPADQEPRWR